jgi:competence protein ComEC
VGQGDAILIKCPSNQNVLIDTGNLSTGYRLGRYLKKQRVSSFKTIVITHMHPDHVGGLFSILPDLRVGKIFDNGAQLIGDDIWEEYINILKDIEIKREILGEGDTFKIDDVIFEILSPSEPLFKDLNADSIAMKMRYGEITFLFAADLNIKAEKRLIRKGINLQSRVLKVGHHGAL